MSQDRYYRQHYQYCPQCGQPFQETRQPLVCRHCKFKLYTNPKPATAVFIIKDQKILLAKRKFKPKQNWWDTPGGFIEFNESIEQGAVREVLEETNLQTKITQYIGSCPDLYQDIPILTIGLKAEILDGSMQAADDVAQLKWFNLKQIPHKIGFKSVQKLLNVLIN